MSNTSNPGTKPTWQKPAYIIGGVIIIALLILGVLAASGAFSGKEPTPAPPTAAPSQPGTPHISILEPANGAVLDIAQPVQVKGEGQALFEGNVVVQAIDADGNVLAQEAATLKGDNVGAGGTGAWSVELKVQDVAPGSKGEIVAFSTDPKSGDRVAETSVAVTFGQPIEPGITIQQPTQGAVLDITRPVEVKGEGQGLFDDNIIVQAVDGQGNVLAEETTLLKMTREAGATGGVWSVQLDLTQATPGTKGKIIASATDAKTGETAAQASIDVTFGEAVEAMIAIQQPDQGAVLDIARPVEVKGEGQGLFEGNVVVQAISDSGALLADAVTTLQGKDVGAGGKGDWSVTLDLQQVVPGTPGQIVSFSTDPASGARVAEASVAVTFGEAVSGPSTLEGPLWSLMLLNGSQPLDGAPIYIQFEDGKLSGSAGCNTYTGDYQSDDKNLAVKSVIATRKACNEPAGVMEQEQTYLTLLKEANSYSTANGMLTIFDASGAPALTFSPAVAGELNYKERIALPDTAQVVVTLEDVSQADAPGQVIGQVIMAAPAGPPIPFIVPYNLNDIDPAHTYAVRAQITAADGSLLFTSASTYHVITQGNPSYVEIELSQP